MVRPTLVELQSLCEMLSSVGYPPRSPTVPDCGMVWKLHSFRQGTQPEASGRTRTKNLRTHILRLDRTWGRPKGSNPYGEVNHTGNTVVHSRGLGASVVPAVMDLHDDTST